MAIPTWVVGQVLSASDVNDWLVPLEAYKFIDESVTNSTTLHPDAALDLSVAANAMYQFTATIIYEGGTQGSSDLKWGWTVPASTTMRYARIGIDASGASTAGFATTETGTPIAGSAGAGTLKAVTMIGTIDTSSTAGTVQFQWAQNTLSATATIVHAGSSIVAQRIG